MHLREVGGGQCWGTYRRAARRRERAEAAEVKVDALGRELRAVAADRDRLAAAAAAATTSAAEVTTATDAATAAELEALRRQAADAVLRREDVERVLAEVQAKLADAVRQAEGAAAEVRKVREDGEEKAGALATQVKLLEQALRDADTRAAADLERASADRDAVLAPMREELKVSL